MQSRLFKATGVAGSLFALFLMLGGHWLALQSVAWARMFADFSRTDCFREAVEKTFDGTHPCKMCVGIRKGRQQEEREQKKLPLVKTEKSPELFYDQRKAATPFARTESEDAVAFVSRLHSDFVESPPIPPPRNLTLL
jgi:hypothetical protein